MSERRPHWDDYLLASVMIHCNDIYQCHAVIAAVEDWHERKGEENLPLLMAMQNADSTKFLHRAEKAEAAIRRVRDVCESSHVDDKGKKVVFLDRILRALDGGGDE